MRIIGAGCGRTGTMSLKLALQQLLGGPVYHMAEVFPRAEHVAAWTAASRGEKVDWNQLFDGYVATVDWPSCSFWRELGEVWPDALFLLSHRDTAGWWKSASSTIFREERNWDTDTTPFAEMLRALRGSRFTPDFQRAEPAMAAYERHNEAVRRDAPKDRLVEWRPGDGWSPLCEALGVPVPDVPFPHANSTDEFLARARANAPR